MQNQAQDNNGDPCRIEDEFFILQRKGVEFTVNVKQDGNLSKNYYSKKARLILTTCRLVLINESKESQLEPIILPFALTREEKFEKPYIGKNHWEGRIVPQSNVKFK